MTTDPNCLFCRIVAGEIPSDRVYEDEQVIGIRDIYPQAPTHVLVMPRRHVPSLDALDDGHLAGALLLAARNIAADLGLAGHGYRVATNTGDWGGQSVYHLHLHVLGGRKLGALG